MLTWKGVGVEVYNLVSLAGLFLLPLLVWVFTRHRGLSALRTVVAGIAIQLLFGVLVFLIPAGGTALLWIGDVMVRIIGASQAGIDFLFGPLAREPGREGSLGFILIFQGLPTVVFFAALMEVLYFLNILPKIVRLFARFFSWAMRTSGAESLCVASNIFVGVESATTVLPYLGKMTKSELCAVLTGGLATIASTVLGLYVIILGDTFPNIAAHLISASLLSAPAALVMAKLFLPETEDPLTAGRSVPPHYDRPSSAIEAIMRGATAGGKLFMGIVVMLLAFLGIVALVNMALSAIDLQLQDILGWVFYPFALLIGVPPVDAGEVARLLGERAVLTEVPAYQHLAELIASDKLVNGRSVVLAGYALCGFAHVAAVAIFVGGVSSLAPERTADLASVAIRAFLAATFACLMTACVAGTFYGSGILLL